MICLLLILIFVVVFGGEVDSGDGVFLFVLFIVWYCEIFFCELFGSVGGGGKDELGIGMIRVGEFFGMVGVVVVNFGDVEGVGEEVIFKFDCWGEFCGWEGRLMEG